MKITKIISILILILSLNILGETNVDATTKVMWGKTELKKNQIGKITILSDTPLFKYEDNGNLTVVRILKAGEEYRVYTFKVYLNDILYGVGTKYFIVENENVKYETPSIAKIAFLEGHVIKTTPLMTTTSTPEIDLSSGTNVISGAPKSFKNCTELREYYPYGVIQEHEAYDQKHDRDDDGWACEK